MDLKNIDLKNINIEDLKAKLQNVDKKTLIKFGAGFAAILIFLIGYYQVDITNIPQEYQNFLLHMFEMLKLSVQV